MACRTNLSLTQAILRQLITYDPETGVAIWNAREELSRYERTWNCRYAGEQVGRISTHGYFDICIYGKRYLLHRVIWLYMTGKWPEKEIDHENTAKTDNRWINLREATPSQNQANKRLQKNNLSGVKGVCWNASIKKWKAQIKYLGKNIALGHYVDKSAAVSVVSEARRAFHGDFARLV